MILSFAKFYNDETYRKEFLPSLGDVPIKFGTIPKNMPYYTHKNSSMEHTASHLCRKGRANKKNDPVCINPWHIIFTTQKINIDQGGCAYGSRQTCPHGNCIWNWPNGEPKNCFNRGSNRRHCKCERKCAHYMST